MQTMRFLNIITAFFSLSSLLLFSTSCHKNSADIPTLTIAAPLADDNFANNQVITIKGEAADAERLHELTIKITDDKTGAVLFSNAPYVHDLKSFAFNVTWTAKVTDWTDATMTITAENYDDQVVVKTVKIKIWL